MTLLEQVKNDYSILIFARLVSGNDASAAFRASTSKDRITLVFNKKQQDMYLRCAKIA
jgi:hypothetical protein